MDGVCTAVHITSGTSLSSKTCYKRKLTGDGVHHPPAGKEAPRKHLKSMHALHCASSSKSVLLTATSIEQSTCLSCLQAIFAARSILQGKGLGIWLCAVKCPMQSESCLYVTVAAGNSKGVHPKG